MLDVGNHNDGFVFGPKPRGQSRGEGPTQGPLVFSSPLPESDSDVVNDIILGENQSVFCGKSDAIPVLEISLSITSILKSHHRYRHATESSRNN